MKYKYSSSVSENVRTGFIMLLCILLVGGIVKLVQLATWKPEDVKVTPIQRDNRTLPTKPIYPDLIGKG